jgi:hypothetical protein
MRSPTGYGAALLKRGQEVKTHGPALGSKLAARNFFAVEFFLQLVVYCLNDEEKKRVASPNQHAATV